MKNFPFAILLGLLISIGCKTEKKSTSPKPEKELTVLEKIAFANGYQNWSDIKQLKFTFNVDRDTSHFERKWIWNPQINEVTGISNGDTATYLRSEADSTIAKVDAAFINDKYWLLAPFQLIWDSNNITNEHSLKAEAPISKKTMQKLTVVYGNEGGYTPGDAYDFYFEDDYLLDEWVFRKGNQPEPSMITTWEDYSDINGLKIAKMHQNTEGNFKLYFTEVDAKMD